MILFLAFLVAAALCAAIARVQILKDPRRGSAIGWAAAAVVGVLACGVAVASDGLIDAAATLTIGAPIVAVPLALFLLNAGTLVLIPDGRWPANAVCGVGGVVVSALLVASVWLPLTDATWLPIALWVSMTLAWVTVLCAIYVAYATFYSRAIHTAHPDYIVVLGAGLVEDQVSPLLAGRVDLGADVFRATIERSHTPILVMSGGQGDDEIVPESDAMTRYAAELGIDPGEVMQESASTTTEENLRNTDALIRELRGDSQAPARGLAVTSDFHAMRAAMLARRLGLCVDAVGAPTERYLWPAAMLRECAAVFRDSLPWQLLAYALVVLPLPAALAYVTWWQ